MRYLCYFLHRHLSFRIPEFEALAVLAGCTEPLVWEQPAGGHHEDSPFYFVDLPNDDVAKEIAARSVLLKGIYEVWGEGSCHVDTLSSVQLYPNHRKTPFLEKDKSFKIVVDCFGHVLTMEEQRERIDLLEVIPFQGTVNLKSPDVQFWFIECIMDGSNNGLPPPTSPWMCFSRQVASSDRRVVTFHDLKKRNYLGPTAMDAEMALIMANQAQARRGGIVYDPFSGTGSILVGAAHFGTITLGADIDIRVVRDGKGPGKNVWSNFKQYGLPMPVGLIRADNNRPPWRSSLQEIIDAIICDPPYGVRAGGRKSGGRKVLNGVCDPYVIPEGLRENHIPSTAAYSLAECLFDLLDISARLLVINGRLVFFYPTAREEYKEEDLPVHPCFKLVANSEQILTRRWSRRLLTMVKVAPYSEELAREADETHEKFRVNHSVLLEESRQTLREIVFAAPPKSAAEIHRRASINGSLKEGKEEVEAVYRPRYRAKCV